jgi:uncharacterized OB-fold protein
MNEPDDEAVFAYYPDVKIDQDNIAHYRGLMAGKLMFNRCGDCDCWIYPHRPLCPRCWSRDVSATEVSGKGKLYMYTFVNQSRDADAPPSEPMQVAAIELAEQAGLRYLSRVINCSREALRHDMAVRLIWIEDKGRRWPAFEPAI